MTAIRALPPKINALNGRFVKIMAAVVISTLLLAVYLQNVMLVQSSSPVVLATAGGSQLTCQKGPLWDTWLKWTDPANPGKSWSSFLGLFTGCPTTPKDALPFLKAIIENYKPDQPGVKVLQAIIDAIEASLGGG